MAEKIYRLNEGGCFCMSEKIYRLNGGDLLLYGRCGCCMSEKIYRLNEWGLILYIREDIPTEKIYIGGGLLLYIYRLNEGGQRRYTD